MRPKVSFRKRFPTSAVPVPGGRGPWILLFCLLWTSHSHASVLVDWNLEDESASITSTARSLWGMPELAIRYSGVIPVEAAPPHGIPEFEKAVDSGIARLATHKSPELFIHLGGEKGGPGMVCHQGDLILVQELVRSAVRKVVAAEARLGPVGINLLLDSCRADSAVRALEAERSAHPEAKGRWSAILRNAESPSQGESFSQHLAESRKHIEEIRRKKHPFCDGCTPFQRLAKVASGYGFTKKAKVQGWSSDGKIQNWSVRDALVSLHGHRSEHNYWENLGLPDRDHDRRFRIDDFLRSIEHPESKPVTEYLDLGFRLAPQETIQSLDVVTRLSSPPFNSNHLARLKAALPSLELKGVTAGMLLGWFKEQAQTHPALAPSLRALDQWIDSEARVKNFRNVARAAEYRSRALRAQSAGDLQELWRLQAEVGKRYDQTLDRHAEGSGRVEVRKRLESALKHIQVHDPEKFREFQSNLGLEDFRGNPSGFFTLSGLHEFKDHPALLDFVVTGEDFAAIHTYLDHYRYNGGWELLIQRLHALRSEGRLNDLNYARSFDRLHRAARDEFREKVELEFPDAFALVKKGILSRAKCSSDYSRLLSGEAP